MNGKLFRDSIISAGISIQNNRTMVDELNVFPVPDGDTGTNMSLTLSAAIKALELTDDNITVSQAADIAAGAMLRGARGNSGVITSLIFRGFSTAFSGLVSANCKDMAKALDNGVELAYKSVINPVEGTILTVAKAAAKKADEVSEATDNISVFWEQVCNAAKIALENTPNQLPALKKAGVVDSGGQGLVILYNAMLDAFNGNKISERTENAEAALVSENDESFDADKDIKYSYCTEYIVEKSPDCKDSFMLRAYLETIGDSVVVVDDNEIIKVHVHTNDPGLAISKALEFGRFVNDPKPKIENMRIQHESRVKDKKISQRQEFTPADPDKEFGFVAVAAGKGIQELFEDLGVDVIIKGGQTMNPSTDDILKAVLSTPAKTVFVLPNNKNILMAAEQAAVLSDRNVCVLPARTIPQGLSAVMAFDSERSFVDNRMEMTKAVDKVSTGQITFAAKDSNFDGINIKKGEILAFNNGKLLFNEKDVNKAVLKLIKKMIKKSGMFVTIIFGLDVTPEQADKLQNDLEKKYGEKAEFVFVNGGQPVYHYIISVE